MMDIDDGFDDARFAKESGWTPAPFPARNVFSERNRTGLASTDLEARVARIEAKWDEDRRLVADLMRSAQRLWSITWWLIATCVCLILVSIATRYGG